MGHVARFSSKNMADDLQLSGPPSSHPPSPHATREADPATADCQAIGKVTQPRGGLVLRNRQSAIAD